MPTPETSKEHSNSFDSLSSKLKRLYIPLPHYNFSHQPYSVDAEDEHFVGRERIIGTLSNWLQDEKNRQGSYLVTGYRGMGKSSFVGKTIAKITNKECNKKKQKKQRNVCYILILALFVALFPFLEIIYDKAISTCLWGFILYGIIIAICITGIVCICKKKLTVKDIRNVNVNLGSEIYSERDVLALVADSIRSNFKEYTLNDYTSKGSVLSFRMLGAIVIPLIAYSLRYVFETYISDAGSIFLTSIDSKNLGSFLRFINDILKALTKSDVITAILYVVIAFFVYRLLTKAIKGLIKVAGFSSLFVTAKEALAKLDRCCERIDSAVDEDSGPYGSISTSWGGFVLKKKRIKRYQIASVREIEQELIQITKLFRNSYFIKSRLIIVLDELDKITVIEKSDRDKQTSKKDSSTPILPEFAYDGSGFPGSNSARIKKQNVLYLLAQIKFFITNANAKFVFISGRELYDAYLADVSDREFSISSIFNGVINVDSFFTCDTQTKDITKMTEMFLCKQLRKGQQDQKKEKEKEKKEKGDGDSQAEKEIYSLKKYHDDLICLHSSNEQKREIEKVIVFLNQFITYLTYLSNGAPKKLTTHFEQYIITDKEYEKQICGKGENEYLKIFESLKYPDGSKMTSAKYFLSFGYYDQQRIGFLHYMTYPVFQTIISPSSEYGDKLLISASFLISHIYKHHGGGFSWRDLEYIPELMESHRTPELRDFINSILSYLGQIHLNQIAIGLYQFKFPMKLYEEISVFSKKSEEISAAFNFSRDDSRSVKQYFADMIEYHSKHGECSAIVLANLHQYMGDLYLLSEEYTEAINQFRTAKDITLKELSRRKRDNASAGKNQDSNASLISRIVRSMLKIGLAYEKRNTVDSAYLVYNELVNLLIYNRSIDEDALGFEYRLDKHDSWEGYKILLFEKNDVSSFDGGHFHRTTHPKFVTKEDVEDMKYWSYSDELIPNLAYHLTPEKSSLISNLSTYEDLKVAYLPLLAKLFAVEKQNVCGITPSNLAVVESEFKFLFLATNNKEKYILSADFFRKLGDILYYKNSDFNSDYASIPELFDLWGYNLKNAAFNFCYNSDEMYKEETEELIEMLMGLKATDFNPDNKDMTLKDMINRFQPSLLQNNCIKSFLKSDYAELPRHVSNRFGTIKKCLQKRIKCNDRRESKYTNFYRPILPCQACKYYNRSLAVLVKKFVPENLMIDIVKETEKRENVSKCIKFLLLIKTKDITMREKNLTQIALSLEAMGNIMLCCADSDDKLRSKRENENDPLSFLSTMVRLMRRNKIELDVKKGLCAEFNSLEKSVLNYYAAAEYYKKASNTKQVTQCYVKIFNLLVSYIVDVDDKCINTPEFLAFVKELYNTLLATGIFSAYSNRDFHSLIESKGFEKGEIKLGYTSIMPDIEEALFAYYKIWIELERRGIKEEVSEEIFSKDILKTIYHGNSLTYLRIDSLTYTRIMSLLFKVDLNFLMIDKMIMSLGMTRRVLSKKAEEHFYEVFSEILKSNGRNPKFVKALAEVKYILLDESSPSLSSNFEVIEFLITDSIFCLTNIIGFLSPTFRSTSFTNGFCGDIYKKLLEWLKIKEFLDGYYNSLAEQFEGNQIRFKRYFESKIDSTTSELLKKTYLAEVAIKYYHKAAEMNSEGQYYQDFIRGLTIVDDDLQNDTCQFYLALERYKLNMRVLYKRTVTIQKGAKIHDKKPLHKSKIYNGLSYFED